MTEQIHTTRACDYCRLDIPADATRCPHCSGEFHYCHRCQALRPVDVKQKFAGIFRGPKEQLACRVCALPLAGAGSWRNRADNFAKNR